jgi:hypothetical protein
VLEYLVVKIKPIILVKQNCSKYNKETVTHHLREIDWELGSDSVQGCWDEFEHKVVKVVDVVAPM